MTPSTPSPATCAPPPDAPALLWLTEAGAPPLFATPRDPAWASDGELVALIAEALGTPLLPWQRHVADVATEYQITAEGIRRYHYQTVVCTVPRQTGKTTLIHALGVYRAMVLGHDFFYTAQTGKDARARWMDLVKALRKSPVFRRRLKAKRIKVALRGGSEHVEFENGHVYQAFAPTEESLHGYTPPTVVLDEAFAHTELEGEMLMGAITPAQQTISARQKWIVSTMGTAASTFLHDWIDRAVAGAPGVAGFYWGAADHHDPYSVEDIERFHPGVGFVLNGSTLTAADVLSNAEDMSRAEYERAFANRRTMTRNNLIPPDGWADLAATVTAPADLSAVVLSYDVDESREAGAVLATWIDPDHDRPVTMPVVAGPGVTWLVDTVTDLARTWRPAAVVAVDNGPVLDITEQIRRRGVDVRALREREWAAASGAFLTAFRDQALRHDGSAELQASVVGLVPRTAVGDGIAFSRRHSTGNSSLAFAAVAGLAVAVELGAAAGREPVLRFG